MIFAVCIGIPTEQTMDQGKEQGDSSELFELIPGKSDFCKAPRMGFLPLTVMSTRLRTCNVSSGVAEEMLTNCFIHSCSIYSVNEEAGRGACSYLSWLLAY